MEFERILQMTASERNLALLQDEAFVDDIAEFLAFRQLYNAAIKQVRAKLEILDEEFQVKHYRAKKIQNYFLKKRQDNRNGNGC